MTDSVSSTARARHFRGTSSQTDEDGKSLRQERATYFAAVLGSTKLRSNAKLVANALLRREGRGGWPRGLVAITETDLARIVGMPKETASRAIKQLKAIGWCSSEHFRPRTLLPNGETTYNGTNVYTIDFAKVLELGPEDVQAPERPTTNVVRMEFARVERELAEERARGQVLEQRLEAMARTVADLAARQSALPPPPVIATEVLVQTAHAAAGGMEPSGRKAGGPVERTPSEERRLRSIM